MSPASLGITQGKFSELERVRPSNPPDAKLKDGPSPFEPFESSLNDFP
jgi:hypothetical protein